MKVTIGIVSQNGLPLLEKCLGSLPALKDSVEDIEFILVDSASSDGTRLAMQKFAKSRSDTRVFAMEGKVNLSATRNVVLKNAAPGAVFLVDGDIEVNSEFLVAAVDEIKSGNADILFGRLPEIWYDENNVAYSSRDDLYNVPVRRQSELFYGIVLLGPRVVEAGYLYDEGIRRHEDVDLAVELAEKFTILALPINMGIHHTRNYFSAGRIKDFYEFAYARPIGIFIRKNLIHPQRIWRGRRTLSGLAVGLFVQLFLVLSFLSNTIVLPGLAIATLVFDVSRFKFQGRLNQYIPIRIVAPWHVVQGFFFSDNVNLDYVVFEIETE